MNIVKVGSYLYQKSPRKNKKLMTYVNGKTIHFGDSRYEHYYDSTNLLNKNYNHSNEERRENYRKRASNIRDKSGNYTYLNPESPNYHSYFILW
jgi:hypothetical protein